LHAGIAQARHRQTIMLMARLMVSLLRPSRHALISLHALHDQGGR